MFSSNTSQVSNDAVYVEDVFSTYLYTGNGSTQTITNGIDLSTKGGLVWTKNRTGSSATHQFIDTVRGINSALASQNTDSALGASDITSFNATGFSLGYVTGNSNFNGDTYASWTFRKQPKFFDVVTTSVSTGGVATFNHSLGSVPGCFIVKSTTSSGTGWIVYHQGMASPTTEYLLLNSSGARINNVINWVDTINSTTVSITNGNQLPNSGTAVGYFFADNAGGFGPAGTDNVISCGSYIGTGSTLNVSLGFEPQWILIRVASAGNTGNWRIFDNMRGWPAPSGQDAYALFPNLTNAETANGDLIYPTATGFQLSSNGTLNGSGARYIYIAIRRGPMKTPTTGTSIYGTQLQVNTPTYSFPPDLIWATNRTGNATYSNWFVDRLRGSGRVIRSYSTGAETAELYSTFSPDGANNSWGPGWTGGANYEVSGFRRAPGFFDEVCYTGTGSATTVTHNLGVAPELMITKRRDVTGSWRVFSANLASPQNTYLTLNVTDAAATASGIWPSVSSTTFGLNAYDNNNNGGTFVAYLFASCPGVSKVGSYTGTGATQTINCGFAARFVLIKRTDSTGNWVVWDTARGMVAGTDPRLELNTTNAETNANWVYTDASGFQIVTTDATVNASGGSYIFWAVA